MGILRLAYIASDKLRRFEPLDARPGFRSYYALRPSQRSRDASDDKAIDEHFYRTFRDATIMEDDRYKNLKRYGKFTLEDPFVLRYHWRRKKEIYSSTKKALSYNGATPPSGRKRRTTTIIFPISPLSIWPARSRLTFSAYSPVPMDRWP